MMYRGRKSFISINQTLSTCALVDVRLGPIGKQS